MATGETERNTNGDELLGWRWREFLATLSVGLGVGVVAVGPCGHVQAFWNPDPSLRSLVTTLAGREAIAEIWQRAVVAHLKEASESPAGPQAPPQVQMVDIGSGLSVAAVTVGGVRGGLLIFGTNPLLHPGEIAEKAGTVGRILGTLYAVDVEARELGAKALRLAAIDEVNKLIVSLFDLESFAVERVLGVIVNALVVLCDAEIGWIAARHPDGHGPFLIARGFQAEEIQRSWEALDPATISVTLSANDPVTACQKLFRQPYTTAFAGKHMFQVVALSMHGRTVGLAGVAGIRDGDGARRVLSSLAPQAVITLEVGSLFAALRRQAGMVLNAIHHGIVVVDRFGRISLQNRFAMKYLSGGGLWPQAEQTIQEVLRGGKPKSRRRQLASFDGEEFVLAWEAVPLTDENGGVAGAVLFFEDETQIFHAKQQLKQAERLAIAGRMAAGMAHEIRNPLAAALGSLQLAKMITEPEKKEQFLDRLAGELQRLNKLLNDFLDTAKPAEPERKVTDVGVLLHESAFFIESEAALAGIQVITETPEKLPGVWVDPGQVKQVFLNLAQNAVEAMAGSRAGRGGTLRITAREVGGVREGGAGHAGESDESGERDVSSGRGVAIAFADNGPGMSEEEMRQLFRPFFTTKKFGIGLGLTTAQAIIHNHGGQITVESRVGEGSVFTVVLPVYEPGVELKTVSTGVEPEAAGKGAPIGAASE